LGADVVLLQETERRWERALRKRFRRDYPHMVFHHHRSRPGGLAVLSRWPLEGEVLAATRGDCFPAWRGTVDSPAGAIQLLNLHLYPPVRRYRRDGWVRAYTESQKTHVVELEKFFPALDRDLPTLVVGDLNEDATGL